MASKNSKQEEPKSPSLNRIIAEVNKKAGENIIGRVPTLSTLEVERISTGVKKVDVILGGGWPVRRIVELYGQPSAGKSLLSLLTIAEAQKQGKECVYIDVEDSFDMEWAKTLGVDVDKLVIAQVAIGEDVLDLVIKLLEARPAIIVIDSVAGMVSQAEMDNTVGKVLMAPRARMMSKGLSMINALNQNTVLIFINQLRATMAMYGEHHVTPGGSALKFYSSVRVEVKATEKIRRDDKKTTEVVGQVVGVKITKNKVAPPFQEASFKLMYTGEIVE